MKCVFAGSFNPFTIGHQNIVDKCLQLFDKVIICFALNPEKCFDHSVRKEMIDNQNIVRELYKNDSRVEVKSWEYLMVDFLKKESTNILVRGIRNSADSEYELQNYYMNKELYPDIVEIFIPCDQKMSHISSTFVRTLKTFGRDYGEYIPTKKISTAEEFVDKILGTPELKDILYKGIVENMVYTEPMNTEVDLNKIVKANCNKEGIAKHCPERIAGAMQDVIKNIFKDLEKEIKFDGHTVSIWKKDFAEIARRYGVELDA